MYSSELKSESPVAELLAEKARLLSRRGVDNGLLGSSGDVALAAFAEAQATAMKATKACAAQDQAKYCAILIQIWIDWSDLLMTLCDYSEAKSLLMKAIAMAEKYDSGELEASLLLANAYRGMSILDYYGSDSTPKNSFSAWDQQALMTLQRLYAETGPIDLEKPTHAQLTYLLATFLTYVAFSEKDAAKAISQYNEAMDLLEQITTKFPNDHEYARRLAITTRNVSYAYREGGELKAAESAAQKGIEQTEQLMVARPLALSNYIDMYYACRALTNHLEAVDGEDKRLLGTWQKAIEATEQVVKLVSSAPKYWSFLTTALLGMASLEEELNQSDDVLLALLDRAITSAKRSVETAQEPNVAHQYDLALALSRRAAFGVKLKKETESLSFYQEAVQVYTEMVFSHKKGKEDEFYIEQCCRVLDGAFDCAKQIQQMNRADAFIKQVVEISRSAKSRKNQQLHSTYLIRYGNLHMEYSRHEKAILVYGEALAVLEPLVEKYPWHFFLGNSYSESHLQLANAYSKLDDTVMEISHRRKYLKYQAVLHGKAALNDWATCDEEAGEQAIIEKLRDKCDNHIPSIVNFKVRCYFPKPEVYSWYTIYVGTAIPGKDPLEGQAQALKEDSGGIVPFDIRLMFRRLQGLALKNKCSFQELCKWALESQDGDEDKEVEPQKTRKSREPTATAVQSGECCICLEALGAQDVATLACGHGFHANCILDWSERHSGCPLCREDIIP